MNQFARLPKKMPYIITFILTIVFTLLNHSAHAQNQFNLSDLEAGQIVLNLSATEQVTVEQDTLTATLEYTAQGRNKNSLQNEVNTAMTAALALLEESQGIDYSTQQYQVYIYQTGRPSRTDIQNPVWRALQRIRLSSTNNSAELLDYIGKLQSSDLHITSLQYSLSAPAYETHADALMNAALQKLQDRADAAALSMNKSSASLIEVTLSNSSNSIYQNRVNMNTRMQANSVDIEPPVATPGETQVSVTVSARALLSP